MKFKKGTTENREIKETKVQGKMMGRTWKIKRKEVERDKINLGEGKRK